MSQQISYIHGRRSSHGVHLFLTIITCGVWGVTGWPFFILLNAMARQKVVTKTID